MDFIEFVKTLNSNDGYSNITGTHMGVDLSYASNKFNFFIENLTELSSIIFQKTRENSNFIIVGLTALSLIQDEIKYEETDGKNNKIVYIGKFLNWHVYKSKVSPNGILVGYVDNPKNLLDEHLPEQLYSIQHYGSITIWDKN